MDNIDRIVLVRDISTATDDGYYTSYLQSSSPSDLTEFNDRLYFAASSGQAGSEFWVSDGTAEGTQIVADIRTNDGENAFDNGSNPRNFIEFSDRLYFTASAGVSGTEVWVSDGTGEGTQLLADIHPNDSQYSFENASFAQEFTVLGDRLFFAADNGENGRELWISDGTGEGTQLLKDIDPGVTDGYFYPFEPRVDSSIPLNLLAVGDRVYFTADDGENGRELWVSDGTTDGTKLVKDINTGFDDSEYIYARIGKSRRLENPRPLNSSPYALTEFNDKIYFTADDGVNGRELWVSDGTESGTQLLTDLNPATDAYGSPNSSYPRNLIQLQDRLYFTADNGESGNELWVTDGTVEGTQLLKDINTNTTPNSFGFVDFNSYPNYFSEFDNKLFFTADDGVVGRELWVTDGTTEGTQLVKDVNPAISNFGDSTDAEGSSIYQFTEFSGRLYFVARTEEVGRELWVTDGTTEGTQLVEDLRPGFNYNYDSAFPYSSNPEFLTVVGNELFFAANNGETGIELFKLTVDDFDSESSESNVDSTSSASVSENGNGVSSSSSSSSSSSGSSETSASSSSSVVSVAGSVTLTGGEGEDRLTGNSGDDFLDGGLGDDTLVGGGGRDTFVLNSGNGTDTIVDFERGSDILSLGSGLQFDDLAFSGHTILADGEVLANLNGVNTESLTAGDFEVI